MRKTESQTVSHVEDLRYAEKIRSEKNLVDLPVILVTSLDSREDRDHGLTVGANAYIIKSSFDQSNLLDVIKRLIGAGR